MFAQSITNDGNYSQTPAIHWVYHNAYRGMPDSTNPNDYDAGDRKSAITRTGLNWFNDYPTTAAYIEDPTQRRLIDCRAKLRTLQNLYYLQHDLSHVEWSVADDEGFDSIYNASINECPEIPQTLKPLEHLLPQRPYVREARRAIGVSTLVASDIERVGDPPSAARRFASALAVGEHPVDLHGCRREANLDVGEKASDIPPWVGGPFHVPFDVFIPETVDGLVLAEKNLSVSRLVNGAIRLQPITMMTGQAAGTLAAVAVAGGVQPREVTPVDVQWALLEAGTILSLDNPADVPLSHPYWKQVQLAFVHGLIDGGPFALEDPMTLGAVATLLDRAFGSAIRVTDADKEASRAEFAFALATAMQLDLSNVSPESAFVDVPLGHQAFAAVQALHARGLVPSCWGAWFQPDMVVSRGDAVSLTVNGALVTLWSVLYAQ
jgi:hypothetical protein